MDSIHMNDICIIINTYNPMKNLIHIAKDIIENIPNIPLIIYDDGSENKESLDIINIVVGISSRITCTVNENNIGLIATRNKALLKVNYDYAMIVDDDCRWPNITAIDTLKDGFKKDPDLFAISLGLKEYTLDNFNWIHRSTSRSFQELATFLGGACILDVKKFKQLGGYKYFAKYGGEELNISLRAINRGWKIFGRQDLWCEHHPYIDQSIDHSDIKKWKAEAKYFSLFSNSLCLAPHYLSILIIGRRLLLGGFGLPFYSRLRILFSVLENYSTISQDREVLKTSTFVRYFKLSRAID